MPIEDFNWDSYEEGASVADTEKQEIEEAYGKTLSQVNNHEVVEGTVISQEADPSEDLHEVIPHFFLVEDIFEDITAVLRHGRICIDFRHHVLDVVLLCLFRRQFFADLIHSEVVHGYGT